MTKLEDMTTGGMIEVLKRCLSLFDTMPKKEALAKTTKILTELQKGAENETARR